MCADGYGSVCVHWTVSALMSPFWLPCMTDLSRSRQELSVYVCEGACQAYRATALHCAQQSNLRVIHFLQIMTLRSAAPSRSLSVYTHFEVIAQISVSACALVFPHSSLLLFFCHSFWALRCTDSHGLYILWWRSVCVCEKLRHRQRRLTGTWPADILLALWCSMNETPPPALVCVLSVFVRSDEETKTSREICIHQTGRQRDGEIR